MSPLKVGSAGHIWNKLMRGRRQHQKDMVLQKWMWQSCRTKRLRRHSCEKLLVKTPWRWRRWGAQPRRSHKWRRRWGSRSIAGMRQSTSGSRAKRKLWSSCLRRKGEEKKARSEQRLGGEAELKTKSWPHKHSPDHVQPAALQDRLDQEQRENELDQHRGVAEHEAELRGEVKLVQLRAEQGFPLKQESPEGKGRKCETAEMM